MILGIMPHNKELSRHIWHRFFIILWLISAFPILLYLYMVVGEEFDFKWYDMAAIVVFSYLAVPVIYRALLYIFRGKVN